AYKHPKTHGTRFINHTKNGLSALLKNWIPLIITLENAIAVSKKTESGKLGGYRRKLAASKFLEVTILMKSVIDVASIASLKLEKRQLFVFDVAYIIELCTTNLELCGAALSDYNFKLEGDQLSLCNKPSVQVAMKKTSLSE
ncbi:hypothetical protein CAPTEDRAFT_214279, partial [Capitella teleta]